MVARPFIKVTCGAVKQTVTIECDSTEWMEWHNPDVIVIECDKVFDVASGYSIKKPRPQCMRRPYPGNKYLPR